MDSVTAKILHATARMSAARGYESLAGVVPRPDYAPLRGGDRTDGIEVPDWGTFLHLVGVTAGGLALGVEMARASGLPGLYADAEADNDAFLMSLRAVRCDNVGRSFVFY